MIASHRSGEAGFVAGLESLAFGVLVFVLGTLAVVNAWAVIDAKFATSAAAREAVRAAVESPDAGAQPARAEAAARAALAGHGLEHPAQIVPVVVGLARCQEVAYRVRTEVPALLLPGITARVRPFVVSSEHREVVDPYRSGLAVTQGEAPACGF
ncbi:hypothetical protein [Egicoccus halophilus]|uniref:TadE-like protein n=1 Tax=Egicoccus halophilus TaxID=1670830 RepID=A0A8J3AEF0_9ACTN|nr:hypothetical protein [Egicoccus halophilus]GGI05619.1 hypothetical protein GCM10011354_14990 [Egicoccus halophilus]